MQHPWDPCKLEKDIRDCENVLIYRTSYKSGINTWNKIDQCHNVSRCLLTTYKVTKLCRTFVRHIVDGLATYLLRPLKDCLVSVLVIVNHQAALLSDEEN